MNDLVRVRVVTHRVEHHHSRQPLRPRIRRLLRQALRVVVRDKVERLVVEKQGLTRASIPVASVALSARAEPVGREESLVDEVLVVPVARPQRAGRDRPAPGLVVERRLRANLCRLERRRRGVERDRVRGHAREDLARGHAQADPVGNSRLEPDPARAVPERRQRAGRLGPRARDVVGHDAQVVERRSERGAGRGGDGVVVCVGRAGRDGHGDQLGRAQGGAQLLDERDVVGWVLGGDVVV